MLKCSSCQTNIIAKKSFVDFLCPSCGEVEIVRCSSCKNLSVKYTCSNPGCKFTGP